VTAGNLPLAVAAFSVPDLELERARDLPKALADLVP
jgi:hypothetical protein